MSDEPAEDSPPQKPRVEEEPAAESPRPCAPREDSVPPRAPRKPRVKKESTTEDSPAPRKPRVKKEPVESAPPADPMFFAGVHDTMKKMVQAERSHRLSNLKFV